MIVTHLYKWSGATVAVDMPRKMFFYGVRDGITHPWK